MYSRLLLEHERQLREQRVLVGVEYALLRRTGVLEPVESLEKSRLLIWLTVFQHPLQLDVLLPPGPRVRLTVLAR
jgi:hypothetical protein